MKVNFTFVFLLTFLAVSANAQAVLKGTVYEDGSTNRMSNVFIRDNNTRQLTIPDKSGNFAIKTESGHLLIFEAPGFIPDTLYLTDLAPKKIYLVAKTIALRQVEISSTRTTFDPHKEYPEVYTKSKVYPLSPSSWFGKEAVDARRLKNYFKMEAQERHIDAVFNPVYVGSLVPLKDKELENFMSIYRPSYAFITDNNGATLAAYINDCYKKYQALPPEKRTVPNFH